MVASPAFHLMLNLMPVSSMVSSSSAAFAALEVSFSTLKASGVMGSLEELVLDSVEVATASEELLLDLVSGIVGLLEELVLDSVEVATASE